MAATTILQTRTRFRPPKIRLHCRLGIPVRYVSTIFVFLFYFIYFLHLFFTTGHLFYITNLKILFLIFKYRIPRINGEGQEK